MVTLVECAIFTIIPPVSAKFLTHSLSLSPSLTNTHLLMLSLLRSCCISLRGAMRAHPTECRDLATLLLFRLRCAAVGD